MEKHWVYDMVDCMNNRSRQNKVNPLSVQGVIYHNMTEGPCFFGKYLKFLVFQSWWGSMEVIYIHIARKDRCTRSPIGLQRLTEPTIPIRPFRVLPNMLLSNASYILVTPPFRARERIWNFKLPNIGIYTMWVYIR